MPKIHLPMQFSTEGAGKMGKLYRTWVSFKVAVETQRHIWSDDRLQEFDKSKVSDSKNNISVTFLRPLWQGKVLVSCCTASFCFHRLKIASPLTNFPLHFFSFLTSSVENGRDKYMPIVGNWLCEMWIYSSYTIFTGDILRLAASLILCHTLTNPI